MSSSRIGIARRSKVKRNRRRRLLAEPLEDRRLLAVSFEFNYLGGNLVGFNDPIQGNAFKTALESAAFRLGGWLLHDAAIQMDVASDSFVGSEFANATSERATPAPDGGFFPDVVPGKLLGQGDQNGLAADGDLQVFFFGAGDPFNYVTDPAGVDADHEIDFQAVMIRELVHALGFSSATNLDGSDDLSNGLVTPGTWTTFDKFLSDADGNRLIDADASSQTPFRMNMSANGWPRHSVGGRGPDNGLFFSGPISTAVYGGAVPLYSPTPTPTGSLYLNDQNISVALGASMDAEPFVFRSTADSLASVLDLDAASSPEDHTQSAHIWFYDDALELDFDFGAEYDLTTVHFWNYFGETYDVDNIDFRFTDASGAVVGTLLNVKPQLGGHNGTHSNPILAEDFTVSLSGKVQFVNAVLSGSNREVDFNNIGFTVATGSSAAGFSVPHLDSEGFPGQSPIFSPRTHLMSQATTGNAVPQELTLLEKAMLADIGIMLSEDIRPTLTVPPNIVIEGNTAGGFAGLNQQLQDYLNAADATDTLDPNPVVTNSLPAFLTLGPNTILFTATDASGNTDIGASTVSVVDTTPPLIDVSSSSVTLEATGPTGASGVTLPVATVSDVVDPNPILSFSPPSNFPLGATTVTYTATDTNNNVSTLDVEVIVQDTTAPLFTVPSAMTITGNVAGGADLSSQELIDLIVAASNDVVDDSLSISALPEAFPFGATAVTFTVTDDSGNSSSSATSLTVRGTTTVSWATPADVPFGTALDATQLNATANTSGTFSYDPPAGTELAVGTSQMLNVTFTPDDLAAFDPATASVEINVLKADPVIDWSDPAAIVFGTLLDQQQLSATASTPGTFSYAPSAGTELDAGLSQTLSVTFTPDNSEGFNPASASVAIDVLPADPVIDWPDPAAIIFGTPLGDDQLNATASVAGTFAYTPAAGTVLSVGANQSLQVTFTPESDNFSSITSTAQIDVSNADDPVVSISPAGPNGASDPADLAQGSQPTSWAVQRSDLSEIVVDLGAPIAMPTANDLVLTNLGVNAPVDADVVVPLSDSQLTLSADSMQLRINLDASQLSDGVYQLELLSAITGGVTFTATGSASNKLYVLTGDWNGSGGVNIQDFATFAYWFGSSMPAAPHYVDINGSGGINIQDFAGFAANFGKQITFTGGTAGLTAGSTGEGELESAFAKLFNRADVNDGRVTDPRVSGEGQAITALLLESERSGDELPPIDRFDVIQARQLVKDGSRTAHAAHAAALAAVTQKHRTEEIEGEDPIRSVDQLLASEDFLDRLV